MSRKNLVLWLVFCLSLIIFLSSCYVSTGTDGGQNHDEGPGPQDDNLPRYSQSGSTYYVAEYLNWDYIFENFVLLWEIPPREREAAPYPAESILYGPYESWQDDPAYAQIFRFEIFRYLDSTNVSEHLRGRIYQTECVVIGGMGVHADTWPLVYKWFQEQEGLNPDFLGINLYNNFHRLITSHADTTRPRVLFIDRELEAFRDGYDPWLDGDKFGFAAWTNVERDTNWFLVTRPVWESTGR